MKLTVISTEPDAPIHVRAEGSITGADLSLDGKDPLEILLGPHWKCRPVMLNLGAVTYIDSSAIGWLIDAQRAVRSGGGAFVVHSAPTNIRQILDVLKVGKVVPLADTESDARALVIAGAA